MFLFHFTYVFFVIVKENILKYPLGITLSIQLFNGSDIRQERKGVSANISSIYRQTALWIGMLCDEERNAQHSSTNGKYYLDF